MDVNALQKLGTGGVGEASKGNLAHPEAICRWMHSLIYRCWTIRLSAIKEAEAYIPKNMDCLSRSFRYVRGRPYRKYCTYRHRLTKIFVTKIPF